MAIKIRMYHLFLAEGCTLSVSLILYRTGAEKR